MQQLNNIRIEDAGTLTVEVVRSWPRDTSMTDPSCDRLQHFYVDISHHLHFVSFSWCLLLIQVVRVINAYRKGICVDGASTIESF